MLCKRQDIASIKMIISYLILTTLLDSTPTNIEEEVAILYYCRGYTLRLRDKSQNIGENFSRVRFIFVSFLLHSFKTFEKVILTGSFLYTKTLVRFILIVPVPLSKTNCTYIGAIGMNLGQRCIH